MLVPAKFKFTEGTGDTAGPKGVGGASAAAGFEGLFHLLWKAGWLSGVPGIGELEEYTLIVGAPGGAAGGGGPDGTPGGTCPNGTHGGGAP